MMRSHDPLNARLVLQQARTEIEDGSPARRESVARVWIARIAGLREPLAERMESVAAEFRETKEAWTGKRLPRDTKPYADQEHEEKSRLLFFGGLAAVTLDVLLAVFASVSFLAFFWLLAAAVGVLVAIVLAVQVEGVLATKWNPELPRRSLQRLTGWAWISFWLSVFGVGVLLFARTNPWAAAALFIVLPVMSLTLPLLAGSLFILSHVYGRFGRLERLHDRLREQVIELDQLLRELRRYIRKEET